MIITAFDGTLFTAQSADVTQIAGRCGQQLQIFPAEFSPLASPHPAQFQLADVAARQPFDRIAEHGRHPPDLTLFAFDHHDPQDGDIRITLLNADRTRRGQSFFQIDAFFPAVQRLLGDNTIDDDLIGLGVFITRMRKLIRQFAVVGQHHQAVAFSVQPANGEQMPLKRDQLADILTLILTDIAGDDVQRFIDRIVVLVVIHHQARAIDFDHIH